MSRREEASSAATTSHPLSSDEGWVDSMVQVAHTANKLFSKHTCRMCQIYTDKQVEYETHQQQEEEVISHPLQWIQAPQDVVDMYQKLLFDEESVVSGTASRNEEENTIMTQRTQ